MAKPLAKFLEIVMMRNRGCGSASSKNDVAPRVKGGKGAPGMFLGGLCGRRAVRRGHLPGAIHLGKGVIRTGHREDDPRSNSEGSCLYCGGGFRSALRGDNIQKMGYRNVVSMDGGFRAWTEGGVAGGEVRWVCHDCAALSTVVVWGAVTMGSARPRNDYPSGA